MQNVAEQIAQIQAGTNAPAQPARDVLQTELLDARISAYDVPGDGVPASNEIVCTRLWKWILAPSSVSFEISIPRKSTQFIVYCTGF